MNVPATDLSLASKRMSTFRWLVGQQGEGSERGLAARILQLHAEDCLAALMHGMCLYSQALWSQ